MKPTQNLLVVLGLDSEKKPHAARFTTADEAAVRKAAGVKGFKIAHAKTPAAASEAFKLVEGKLFDSGKGLVPFCTQDCYDKLLRLLEIEAAPANPSPAPEKTASVATQSDLWAAIKIGSLVLCKDDERGADQSWWECAVTGVSKDGKLLTVCWKNYPTLKPFTVKRSAVAIIPSKP